MTMIALSSKTHAPRSSARWTVDDAGRKFARQGSTRIEATVTGRMENQRNHAIGWPFKFTVAALQGVGGARLGAMGGGKGHRGKMEAQDASLGLIAEPKRYVAAAPEGVAYIPFRLSAFIKCIISAFKWHQWKAGTPKPATRHPQPPVFPLQANILQGAQ
jgi:hypothetical protein